MVSVKPKAEVPGNAESTLLPPDPLAGPAAAQHLQPAAVDWG